MMILKKDCRHFPGSYPCSFNKYRGQLCSNCAYYKSRGYRILIIKLDAIGDVLRTTSLLPAIKSKYPESYIVWITKSNAESIFKYNNYVDEVWTVEKDAIARLNIETFDLVINTDADKYACSLATMAKCKERLGMALDESGIVYPVNHSAVEWLEMGAFDQYKQLNKKTYQQIIHEICRLKYYRSEPILTLSEKEINSARRYLEMKNIGQGDRIIAVNLGGGERWKKKCWTKEHIISFSKILISMAGFHLLIIGGPYERELLKELSIHLRTKTSFSGHCMSLREIASLVACCSVVVTGDTLVLHMATALKIPVVALFGPTSANEIDLYDRGEKLIATDCHTCYLTECEKTPTCMELITPETVIGSVMRLIKQE